MQSSTLFVPGSFVRHPLEPDWGVGQVQSIIGTRITVNFTHRGKVVMDLSRAMLEPADRAGEEEGSA